MQRGPRLYNALSDEERLARLRRKAARKEKEVHRVRKNRIIACFAIAILIFGLQLIMVHVQTGRINSQIQTNKAELNQVNKTNKKLKSHARAVDCCSHLVTGTPPVFKKLKKKR